MSGIKINNEKQLMNFLKLVAQESVKKSLRETDSHVVNYNKQLNLDSKTFPSLKEEEEEEVIDIEDEDQDEDDNASDNDINNKAEKIVSEVTPRKIISKINNIRAGHSLKNSEVKESLITFLERLDENELLVLFYYLDDIAKILNMSISGEEAIDPSEDPLNINMTRGEKEDKPAEQPEKNQKASTTDTGGEDTSPPIKVNESQDKESLRRKIRILMS